MEKKITYKYLNRIKEDWNTNIQILEVTKFNNINIHNKVKIEKIVLDFSFKEINFDKKKMFSFLLILELITGQKAILT
jgi:ribosomal protein L5